jgi:integrase/recombinase XerD
MLTIWRRHNPAKCKFTARTEQKCRCVIWMTGTLPSGEKVRESTRLRDWTRAETISRQREVQGKFKQSARVTLKEWKTSYLQDAESPSGRNLNAETLRKYKLLFKQLDEFATDNGLRFVNQLDLETLTAFRSTWKIGPLSAQKKLERLRSVLKFALRRKWIEENAAVDLVPPKVKQSPTLPFSSTEMKAILKAATDVRVRAFILVMRYGGLRISDATTLACASLQDDRLRLYQAKTGEPVYLPLPAHVATALRSVPHKHPNYFFWSGHSTVPAAASMWRRRISDVFKAAKISDGHSHRFRDTFAVELLQAGVSLENVSVLLGHQNIRVTEKHYSPWVQTRQAMLDDEVRRATARAEMAEGG